MAINNEDGNGEEVESSLGTSCGPLNLEVVTQNMAKVTGLDNGGEVNIEIDENNRRD